MLSVESKDSSNQFVEASSNRRQRRRSSNSDVYRTPRIDHLLQDENNDWFFEKILDKFEDLRARKRAQQYIVSRSDDSDYAGPVYGPERIIERRYYVKRSASLPKRSEYTSTTDLKLCNSKIRQLSGESSITVPTEYSQSSASAPLLIENFCNQSDALRNEISSLRHEIEKLQETQTNFFTQVEAQFRESISPTIPTTQHNVRPKPLPPPQPTDQRKVVTYIEPVPKEIKRAHSVSTESLASTATESSSYSERTLRSADKNNVGPLSKVATPAQPVTQFLGTKNASFLPAPAVQDRKNSDHSSASNSSTPPISQFVATKNQSNAQMLPVNSKITHKQPSVTPTPPITQHTAPKYQPITTKQNIDSKASSVSSTLTIEETVSRKSSPTNSELSGNVSKPPMNTKPLSQMPKPPMNNLTTAKPPPISAASSKSSSPNSIASSLSPTPPLLSNFTATKPLSTPPALFKDNPPSSKASSVTSILPMKKLTDSNYQSAAPTPQSNSYSTSKPPSITAMSPKNSSTNTNVSSTELIPSMNTNVTSKPPLVTPIQPSNTQVSPNPSATVPIASKTQFIAPKNQSTGSTLFVNGPKGSVGSTGSSIVLSSPIASSSKPPTSVPIYENELAYRRTLSPRSQIVAASVSNQESSDESDGSTSPELIYSEVSQPPKPLLQDNELKALAQYSSQLELAGYRPSVTPVITNPNTSNTFWESVDQFITDHQSRNPVANSRPLAPRSVDGTGHKLSTNITKQLDKYNLEIKPQEIIESSAPLLMPPLDILP